MSCSFPYDDTYDPPAPVLPIHVSVPGGGEGDGIALRALLDTGADLSVLPRRVLDVLALPVVDQEAVTGVGGSAHLVPICAAVIRIGGWQQHARFAMLGNEALIGRDLCNQWLVTLTGATSLELQALWV
ncbi:MAG: aspartyl protease family protein [Clostridia bacterium]|nr:aspartyl protease family protein [Clostridia bacterium]